VNLPQPRFANLGTLRASILIGALPCIAGLMSYPWRGAIFLLWPTAPKFLLTTIPRAVAKLVAPGMHLAGWMATAFGGEPGGAMGYVSYLGFGLLGLALNFALWTAVAYALLRAAAAFDHKSS
jgi:hypothetical protein